MRTFVAIILTLLVVLATLAAGTFLFCMCLIGKQEALGILVAIATVLGAIVLAVVVARAVYRRSPQSPPPPPSP